MNTGFIAENARALRVPCRQPNLGLSSVDSSGTRLRPRDTGKTRWNDAATNATPSGFRYASKH